MSEICGNEGSGEDVGTADNVAEAIGALAETLLQWQEAGQEITAPVDIPRREDMTVTLVPLDSVERLEEYRAEKSLWHGVWTVFVGAVLGMLVNSVTGGHMTTAAWVLIAVFLIMAALAFASARRYKRRGDQLRDQMLASRLPRPPADIEGQNLEEE